MNNKTVLITGGAKRIGRGIALYLAECGYSIALHYNSSKTEAETLVQELSKLNSTCKTYKCNLEDFKKVEDLIPQVSKDFGQIDLLINNASVFEMDSIRDVNLKRIQQNLNVHYIAPYILISQFAKHLKKGHIINILDRHVKKGRTSFASYLISKKALLGLTEVAAAELAPSIRVNAIAPGFIISPENKNLAYAEERIQNIPAKRKGEPIDIANAVAFLEKNSYITGQTLFVDGGESLN